MSLWAKFLRWLGSLGDKAPGTTQEAVRQAGEAKGTTNPSESLPEPPGRFDLFQPEERQVFYYFDGEKVVREDPLPLYRRYAEVKLKISAAAALAESIHSEAAKGYEEYLDLIRGVFNVRKLDERGGLSEQETVDLFNHFILYFTRLKKNARNSPTSPTGTSPASTTSTTAATESPPATSSFSGSGSTASAPSTAPGAA